MTKVQFLSYKMSTNREIEILHGDLEERFILRQNICRELSADPERRFRIEPESR